MSETWYDSEEDVLGIQLARKKYWKTVEVSQDIAVDLSDDGDIIGLEVFHAKQHFKKDAPLIVSKARQALKITDKSGSR